MAKFTPRDLRRTIAGDLLDVGTDLATVQKLMEHSNANTTIALVNHQVTVEQTGNVHITCTFTNQRKSVVRALAYNDYNGDGQQNYDERPLNQWRILLYNAQGSLVPTEDNLTNQQGKESYDGLTPGNYTICEELKERWINTQPGLIDPTYQQPCYQLTVGPGQIAQAYFGNVDHPVASAAQADATQGVVIFDAPDTEADEAHYDMVDTDEVWLNAPWQSPGLFMPLIVDDGS